MSHKSKLATSITGTNIKRNRPLTDDELRAVAPSAFATEKHIGRSERYTHIPTYETIKVLRKEGFEPFFATQANTRDETKVGHTKHLIRFRREAQIDAPRAEEICLINSSDASSGGQLFAGILEAVCQNSNVVGSVVQDIRVRHSGNVVNDFIEGAYSILSSFDLVRGSIEEMQSIRLDAEQKLLFGRTAMALRWDEKNPAPVDAAQIITPRRREQPTDSLYSTFQVAQENICRGGQWGMTTGKDGKKKHVRVRPINGITENTRLNQALWSLAEGMRQLKTGLVEV